MKLQLNEVYNSLTYHGVDMPFLIGSYGNVINISANSRDKIIIKINKNGRRSVHIIYDGKEYYTSLARCIALAFIPIPNNESADKFEADHINGDRTDDRLENIQWLTPFENRKKEINEDGFIFKGEDNGMSKITEDDAKLIIHEIINGLTPMEISSKYNISRDIIIDIKRGRTWRHLSKDYDIDKYVNRRSNIQKYDDEFKDKIKNTVMNNPSLKAKGICNKMGIEYNSKHRLLINNIRRQCM